MTDKEIISMLEHMLEFWSNELSRAYMPSAIHFRKGVVYGLQLAIENIQSTRMASVQSDDVKHNNQNN